MPTQFRDASGQERLLGTIYAPGATVGDVFTVQADWSLAPAPGGGSQTLTKTLTAAEITARWDGDAFYSAIEWTAWDVDTCAVVAAEIATTLDGDLTFASIYAYDSGATTADVVNNGEQIVAVGTGSPGTYRDVFSANSVVTGGTVSVSLLRAGKAAYIVYAGGTTPPTTGTATIRALRLT